MCIILFTTKNSNTEMFEIKKSISSKNKCANFQGRILQIPLFPNMFYQSILTPTLRGKLNIGLAPMAMHPYPCARHIVGFLGSLLCTLYVVHTNVGIWSYMYILVFKVFQVISTAYGVLRNGIRYLTNSLDPMSHDRSIFQVFDSDGPCARRSS